jgi:phosphoribosylaminoimidazolecarboxamide formyltransferase/IMP cyclohydrolase
MKRALLSVSDKRGIVELGRALSERGWQLLSTGGTAKTLRDAGLEVTGVSDVTGHPEMMGGRVKTLHPAIHAGLLARRDREDDMASLEEQGYGPIDLVAVNLYPFREKVTGPEVPPETAMEVVDIGGPTMIRSAAKSHRDVWVVVDPEDYQAVVGAIDGAAGANGGVADGVTDGGATDGRIAGATGASSATELRRRLAAKVFRHVSAYDAAVARYLDPTGGCGEVGWEALPPTLETTYERIQVLRYGENPDQEAAFYGTGDRVGLAALEQHHGKELSYNNILDLDGAILSLAPFAYSPRPAVCIVKHTTPCGLALGDSLADAYRKALATDPTSAFGSVIAVNREVDAETAELMSELFVECVVAPVFSDEAMATLTRKKNVRLMTFPGVDVWSAYDAAAQSLEQRFTPEEARRMHFLGLHGTVPSPRTLRSVYGGLLVQTPPTPPWYGMGELYRTKVVTRRQPTQVEWDDLRFAWAAIFGVKSNAILLARDGGVLGIGAGQTSRVDSSKIAVRKAGDAGLELAGAVLASDAFFPFRDGVDAAAEAGVAAVIQPGGSIRDEEVVAAADEHGMAMVFTGRRLFRH